MNNLYEKYHKNRQLQYRLIDKNNFTYKKILKYINKYFYNNNLILDIGCGVGTLDFYLASRGHIVYGIDIAENAINIANINSELFTFKHKPKFLQKNINYFNTKLRFDGILMIEVLEHLSNEKIVLSKVSKMIKKGGYLISSSPSVVAPLYKLGMLKNFDKEVGHLHRYSIKQYINMFEKYKFKIIEIVKSEGIFRNFLFTNKTAGFLIKLLRGPLSIIYTFVDDISIKLLGESNIILIARKM